LGTSSDEIARQIAETREDIEDRIVVLRERSALAVRRGKRVILMTAGIGAAVAVAVVGCTIVYRLTRPVTVRERVGRVFPLAWWERLQHLRESWELGLRKQVPPLRVYVGDKQVGEEPPSNTMQKVALRVAQAAGTAIGGAIVQRVMSRFDKSDAASTG
jgi:hypothetical protein